MTELQAVYIMWMRQLKRFVRARSRVIAHIIQPFLFLSIFGLGFASVRFPGMKASYMDFIAPGIIAMAIIFSSMFAGVSVLWDRQFGFLKEVLVAPVSRLSIVIGRTLGGSTTALIQGFIILVISLLLGVKIYLIGLLPAILLMFLISFTYVSFGLAIASKIEDFHGFQLIMNLIIMPLFLLSTAFFPLNDVPKTLRFVMYLDPLTYAVDGLRGSLIGVSVFPIHIDFLIVSIICISMILIGSWFFNKLEV